jgi:hypothetical protein
MIFREMWESKLPLKVGDQMNLGHSKKPTESFQTHKILFLQKH